MQSEKSSQARRLSHTSGTGLAGRALFVAAALATLTGCGLSGSAIASEDANALSGSVRSGYQPVSGSHLQLYAAGINGVGSAAQPLLSNPVQSDVNGKFVIPADFDCPSQSSQIFAVASGGNPGLSSGTNNPALALTVMLGSCSSLSAASPISIDEVTTVGSVWPLASYMKSPTDVGSAAGDSGFLSAASSVPEFINLAQDTSPGGYILNNTIENTLADSITQINGSYNITVSGNRIFNSGDDGISNNSYVGEPLVHDITVQGNTVLNNSGERGLEVSGATTSVLRVIMWII